MSYQGGEFIRKLHVRSSLEVCELGDEINKAVGKDLTKDGNKLVMRRKMYTRCMLG